MKKELALVPSKYFDFQRTGVVIKENTPIDEWLRIGEVLKKTNAATQWWIGDWLNFGEGKYGEMYSQALEATDYDYGTLRNFKFVASKVELSCRHDNLSFQHHWEVAKLEQTEQKKWLKEAVRQHWNVKELRQGIKVAYISNTVLLTEGLDINIEHGDFRELIRTLKPNSIDLILTDPPYPREYLPLWSDLAKEAARVLKPSGFLIAYSGQNNLPKILQDLAQYL